MAEKKPKATQKKVAVAQKKVADADDDIPEVTWKAVDVLTEELNLERWAVNNTVQLLDDDNTIPFIARYRKEQTNNMEADTLRDLNDKYQELKSVEQKVQTVYKAVAKLKKMTPQLKSALVNSQTMSEVEHLFAPYKSASKRTLAERARELGLEKYAKQMLETPRFVDLSKAVVANKKGVSSVGEVETGVQHILADMIAKDKDTMDHIRQLCKFAHVTLESTKSPTTEKGADDKVKTEKLKADKKKPPAKPHKVDPEKFQTYFNFTIPVKYAKPHQVLAINRGESLKVLTVRINIPDQVRDKFKQFCVRRWIHRDANEYVRGRVDSAVEDAYKRLIQPLMIRHFRSELTKQAEKASVDVFASNLKKLLLAAPVRGKVVLGVDPGFRNGCKWAIMSPTGEVFDHGVSYLHDYRAKQETERLAITMNKNRCETVAIGNGTACRETEKFFSDEIGRGAFKPLNVMYCIVNEAGASIYSASDDAKKEMPDLDITIRGAVSIGRRVQDPLAELVKIEPRHIGVGMYQHDVTESMLKSALDGVVEDCVSFVGVDINTCSEPLLRRIAGMNASRAKKIIEHRQKNQAFVNRQQLMGVTGIGPKVFEQCAGFVRVVPETRGQEKENKEEAPAATTTNKKRKAAASGSKTSKKAKLMNNCSPNNLDMTSIHPESYAVADSVISDAGADKEYIGQLQFIQAMKQFFQSSSVQALAEKYNVGVPTLQLIIDGLQQPLGHDVREEFEKPLFKQALRSLSDLKRGSSATGKVVNVTHFGAFVDIGVGQDGLIHSSQMRALHQQGRHALELGDRVEVIVDNVELQRKRIGLRLVKVL